MSWCAWEARRAGLEACPDARASVARVSKCVRTVSCRLFYDRVRAPTPRVVYAAVVTNAGVCVCDCAESASATVMATAGDSGVTCLATFLPRTAAGAGVAVAGMAASRLALPMMMNRRTRIAVLLSTAPYGAGPSCRRVARSGRCDRSLAAAWRC